MASVICQSRHHNSAHRRFQGLSEVSGNRGDRTGCCLELDDATSWIRRVALMACSLQSGSCEICDSYGEPADGPCSI